MSEHNHARTALEWQAEVDEVSNQRDDYRKQLAAKERECAMLREMYSFESRSSKKFIREMLKKAAAGGEVTK